MEFAMELVLLIIFAPQLDYHSSHRIHTLQRHISRIGHFTKTWKVWHPHSHLQSLGWNALPPIILTTGTRGAIHQPIVWHPQRFGPPHSSNPRACEQHLPQYEHLGTTLFFFFTMLLSFLIFFNVYNWPLQGFLGAEVTNMNVCVPFIFPHIYVSQMVYNWPL